MIIFFHNKYLITEVVSTDGNDLPKRINQNITGVILEFANLYENEILVWCSNTEKDNLNDTKIESFFHHHKLLFSFSPSEENYFGRRLGYIEDSPYINVNKEVRYPTWQMSSVVGAVHASVLNACKNDLYAKDRFDYFLVSFARRAITNGIFCYSEPKLLRQRRLATIAYKSNLFELFKFTKQHYKTRWVFLLFFNLLVYEKKLIIFPFLSALMDKRRKLNPQLLNKIPLNSTKKIIEKGTIDVLIPTIGRKKYLFEVLSNLALQTYLPKNVIIIEQNPDLNSLSDLDFIHNKKWPFKILHHFTHQTGVCNARNIGLSLIESEFCFLADDDIIFQNDLIEKAMEAFRTTGNEVFLIACHLKTQSVVCQLPPVQFSTFGAGHAFVKSDCLRDLKFNLAFEFGFGEDADFGMKLRNKGYDILYISTSSILHLKAPIGGFRTKPILEWQDEAIQPKPSPTVMLYRLFYDTREQLCNYKTILFFKNLKISIVYNPFKYIKIFKHKWNRSIYWAKKLDKHLQ